MLVATVTALRGTSRDTEAAKEAESPAACLCTLVKPAAVELATTARMLVVALMFWPALPVPEADSPAWWMPTGRLVVSIASLQRCTDSNFCGALPAPLFCPGGEAQQRHGARFFPRYQSAWGLE